MAKDKETIERHLRQWAHNRSLIGQIPAAYPDWIVTIVFYTAVHAVDAALANEGVTVWNHDTRFAAISGIKRFQRVGGIYHQLYDLSRKVRYTADPNLWIPPDQIESRIGRGLLLPLERSVMQLISANPNVPALHLSHLSNAPQSATEQKRE